MLTLGFFDSIAFRIPLIPSVLFLALLILVTIWMIYSVIIRYHWKQYGTSALETTKMSVIYFTGSFILLAGMFVFAVSYLFTALEPSLLSQRGCIVSEIPLPRKPPQPCFELEILSQHIPVISGYPPSVFEFSRWVFGVSISNGLIG